MTLNTGTVSLRRLHLRPGEALAIGQILDTRVRVVDPDLPDLAGIDVPVVDLGIERTRTRDWVVARVAVRTGRRGLRRGETHVVEWSNVRGMTQSSLDLPGQGVAQALLQFEGMRAADVANALRELPVKRRDEIASALDDERLADVLQELPPDDQKNLLSHLELDRAVDVLEAMDPDDAADLLGELSDTEAESFLARMDPEDSEPVRRLLTHSPDTAGGLMTSEPIIVTPRPRSPRHSRGSATPTSTRPLQVWSSSSAPRPPRPPGNTSAACMYRRCCESRPPTSWVASSTPIWPIFDRRTPWRP